MRKELLGPLVSLPLFIAGVVMAQTQERPDPPAQAMLLTQSELSHLEGADQPVTLEIKEATPGDTLAQIDKAARITIQVEGRLPREPKLSASFKERPVKEVLVWFSKQVDVVYRAEPGGRLMVFTRSVAESK